jgi:UDP-hydrolysing UDP-N-acetyl-D-glucosamine 2-epimerase
MRNIAVFIGNRADAGPLGPVVKAIEARADLKYAIVDQFTWQPQATGERYDMLLVLGDRHELLIACHDAVYCQMPIAHIHGGETTLGSFDDRVRNAVSQLATLHFTAAECFSSKLRAMKVPGEIFTVGPPGLDDIETDETSEFGSGFFLVCLHPDTTRDGIYNNAMRLALVTALERFPDRPVVVIDCNNDPHHEGIRAGLRAFADATLRSYPRAPIKFVHTLPRRRYLTALKHAAVCIGNSSSFVIEAPALGTPTVLVGDRQKGRPLAWTIQGTADSWTADDIVRGIRWAIANRHQVTQAALPYGRGGASQKIAEILATWSS